MERLVQSCCSALWRRNAVKTVLVGEWHHRRHIWTAGGATLLRPKKVMLVRPYGTLVLRALRHALKLRYWVLGGAVGGGAALSRQYDEWRQSLADLTRLLPDTDKWQRNTGNFTGQLAGSVANGVEKLGEVRQWWQQRLQHAIEAANKRQQMEKEKENRAIQETPILTSASAQMPFSTNKSGKKSGIPTDNLLAQQAEHQKQLDALERQIRDLRRQNLLLKQGGKSRQMKKRVNKTLLDMYSDVLDELAEYDSSEFNIADQLPRVVVVGDQSAGKTSVLEMIAQARIFPRGAGEMMTRAPVKVTLSEGPYRIATLRNSQREYDLTKESDLADLRSEVEQRMKRSIRRGSSVSTEVISMSVKGPGLPRMVLVDLPGVISTVTQDMARNTKDQIRHMTQTYMENPNAIILCIQDGSVDAERSNVTELVSACDPTGQRTIFVLTKVDLAEKNLANPQRLHRILSGKLFPMKALGYFAVVTGTGRRGDESIDSIRDYEREFFANSSLFRQDGGVSLAQVTTRNLSTAVAERFWLLVRDTVAQQADAMKARRCNLEAEWHAAYPNCREQDREKLFLRARHELLDEVLRVSALPASWWESQLSSELHKRLLGAFFADVYLPQLLAGKAVTDAQLRAYGKQLSTSAVDVGRETLVSRLMLECERTQDEVLKPLKKAVLAEALSRHQWEAKAMEILMVIQGNALDDELVKERHEWDQAVDKMADLMTRADKEIRSQLDAIIGPSLFKQWLFWRRKTTEQEPFAAANDEITKLLMEQPNATLQQAKRVLEHKLKEKKLQMHHLEAIWQHRHPSHILKPNIERVYECRRMFQVHKHGLVEKDGSVQCDDVMLFWRVQSAVRETVKTLRLMIGREAVRFDRIVNEVLEDMSEDSEKLRSLLTGRRVTLAEELKNVRRIQEKLEEFIKALNQGQTF